MLAWVVMNRQQPRQARKSRPKSPILPGSHSHFGSHLTPVPEKSDPFFSCTYVEPILHPLCFQIHAWNGGVPPSTKNATTHEHYNRQLQRHPRSHRSPAENSTSSL